MGVGPSSGRRSGVYVYCPACSHHCNRAGLQTSSQRGGIRASAWSLRGSSSPKANADEVGTSSSGGSAGNGAVQSAWAPPPAGRQCAPVSNSIVMGAPAGTCGTSGTINLCRRTVASGRSRSASFRGQVGKALPRLGAAQQLDIGQPPLALRRGQVRLDLRALIRPGDEQVALVEKAHIHALVKLVEEGDAFPNQLDFFRVVELQPEGAGRHRRGERRQRRPLLENA